MRQLLRFWVELPDTLVSFCKCEQKFEFLINGYVENLTRNDVTVACGSSPIEDYAIIPEPDEYSGALAAPAVTGSHVSVASDGPGQMDGRDDFCRTYSMLLPGELDMPWIVTLKSRETRVFEIHAWPGTECFEDGRYEVFWALVDCSSHWEHYVFDDPGLNSTLLAKPDLLAPALLRLIESSN
jgi:hypothetical protein